MELRNLDDKPVRLVTRAGEVFEGVSVYHSADYCEHEYGINDECLQIVNFLFPRSDIVSVEDLEGSRGPYGPFSAPYGRIEEMNARDDINIIRDVLESEEPEDVRRMLACLDCFLRPEQEEPLSCRAEVLDALRHLSEIHPDPGIRREAARLAEQA